MEISLEIEENWRPPFRIEYDGKYITLYGKDADYPQNNPYSSSDDEVEYEEMVLVPVVVEVREADPKIKSTDGGFVTIEYCVDK